MGSVPQLFGSEYRKARLVCQENIATKCSARHRWPCRWYIATLHLMINLHTF